MASQNTNQPPNQAPKKNARKNNRSDKSDKPAEKGDKIDRGHPIRKENTSNSNTNNNNGSSPTTRPAKGWAAKLAVSPAQPAQEAIPKEKSPEPIKPETKTEENKEKGNDKINEKTIEKSNEKLNEKPNEKVIANEKEKDEQEKEFTSNFNSTEVAAYLSDSYNALLSDANKANFSIYKNSETTSWVKPVTKKRNGNGTGNNEEKGMDLLFEINSIINSSNNQ